MIRLLLASKKIACGREFGIAALRDAGKPIRINLAVANHFSRHVGFVIERRRRWSDVGDTRIARPSDGPSPNRRHAARVDVVDRRFRDGVSVFAQVVLDVILRLADLVSPDGASILEVNDVRSRRQRRAHRQHHKH